MSRTVILRPRQTGMSTNITKRDRPHSNLRPCVLSQRSLTRRHNRTDTSNLRPSTARTLITHASRYRSQTVLSSSPAHTKLIRTRITIQRQRRRQTPVTHTRRVIIISNITTLRNRHAPQRVNVSRTIILRSRTSHTITLSNVTKPIRRCPTRIINEQRRHTIRNKQHQRSSTSIHTININIIISSRAKVVRHILPTSRSRTIIIRLHTVRIRLNTR